MGSTKIGNIDTLRRIAAGGDVIAFLMLLGTTVLPDPDPSDHHRLYLVALVPLCLGIVLFLGRGLPERVIKLLAISCTTAAVSLMVSQILPMGAALMFYCWPAVTAGYFCTRRELAANLVLIAVGSAIALKVSQSDEITGSTWMATVGISTIVALTVGHLAEQVTKLATTDELSGLLNRRAFGPILDRSLARAQATGTPVSVVAFDLDHFKRVNDNYGHLVGDDVLMEVAGLLQNAVRAVDVVARYGGEEFVIALPETGTEGATRFAERLREMVEAHPFSRGAQGTLHLTASIGVASFPSMGWETVEDFLAGADQALYRAKAEGRNRVRGVEGATAAE